jgi:predicted MPP superfamily phosphohydrolase
MARLRARARHPTEMTRRDVLRAVTAAGIGAAAGMISYGFSQERHDLVVTHTALPVSGLPSPLIGLRIALLTDVHHSRLVPASDVEAAVRRTMAERPDVIVLGGDYVTYGDRHFVGPVAELLAPLAAPFGVFAILGNHDDDKDMPAALAGKGFTVLKDARTHVTIRGERLDVVGIRFWTRKAAEIARTLRGAAETTLMLAHDPRRLAEAAELNVPLVLSGHTHGGQIVLPLVGAVAKVGQFPVLQGTTRQQNTTLYVSRGIGTVYVPIRYNCPPEVAIITLERHAGF